MGRKSCMKAVYNWPNKMLVKYNTVLMNHPVRVMLVVLGLSVSCTVYTVRVGSLPDFSEPTLVSLCIILRLFFSSRIEIMLILTQTCCRASQHAALTSPIALRHGIISLT